MLQFFTVVLNWFDKTPKEPDWLPPTMLFPWQSMELFAPPSISTPSLLIAVPAFIWLFMNVLPFEDVVIHTALLDADAKVLLVKLLLLAESIRMPLADEFAVLFMRTLLLEEESQMPVLEFEVKILLVRTLLLAA
ncbi:Uncharacterised protein [Candidatus Anstonella stagnisolia]|nr:Uncharacterised protein [Candidatus Anstonella stagnisolia]